MASTTSNLELTTLANDALASLRQKLDMVTKFSFKADGNKQFGDSVNVYVNSVTDDAAAFNASSNNYGDVGADDTTGVLVTLDKRIKKTFSIDDVDAGRIDVEKKLADAVSVVGKAALKLVYDEMTAANFAETPAFTGAATAFDYDVVVDIDDVANEAGLSEDGRVMVLDNTYASNLKKDGHLTTLRNSQGNTVASQWEAVSSFDVGTTTQIKSSANYAATENLRGFITDGSGLAIAMGSVPAPSSQGTTEYSEVIDPETGFILSLRRHYDDNVGAMLYTVEIVFGLKVTRGTGLIRIVSA